MTIKAINKKYQSPVNKAYTALRKYYALVDISDNLDLYSKEMKSVEAKQEKAYNNYLDILDNLPAREKAYLSKQHFALHGYT